MRRVWITAALAAALAMLAGCGGDEDASGQSAGAGDGALAGKTVAFANFTEGAPQTVLLRENLERDADRLGVELKLFDNKADGQTALTNARLIAQQKPDVALEYNPVQALAKSLMTVFTRADVPCIWVNIPGVDGCAWFNLSNQTLCGDTGRYVGKAANDRGWNGSNTSVILVQAAALGDPVNTCLGFFYEKLQEQVDGLSRIDSYREITPKSTAIGDTTVQVEGKGLREPSFRAVSSALQNIPKNRNVIVYTVSDDSAMGAWRAVERAGRADKAMTAGLTGTPEGLTQLRENPGWIAQGTVFYESWGGYLLAMSKALLDGVELPDMTTSPVAVLTKDEAVAGTSIVPVTKYYKDGETTPFKLPPLEPVHEGETSGLGPGTIGNGYLADTGVLQVFGKVEGLEATEGK